MAGCRLHFLFCLAFSLYSSVQGGLNDICTSSDQAYLQQCLNPLVSNLQALLECNVHCSVVTNLVNCINGKPFTVKCLGGLQSYMDEYLEMFGSSCSYDRIKSQCPQSPDLIIPQAPTVSIETDACSSDDRERLLSCITPLITDLPALVECRVACSDVTAAVNCVNGKSLTEKCVRGLPDYIDNQAATFGSQCTYTRLKRQCPDAPDLIYSGGVQPTGTGTEATSGGALRTNPGDTTTPTGKTNGNKPVSSASRFDASVRWYILITILPVILLS